MATPDVIEVTPPDHPNLVGFDVSDPLVEVIDFIEDHVPTVATSSVEKPSCSRVVGMWGDHFDELVSGHHESIDETELADALAHAK